MPNPINDAYPTLAAVDLGSNSFHMIVALATEHGFRVVDRMRSAVRLAADLEPDNVITDKAIARAITCLEQFGERVRDLPQGAVRVVGTNTLRKARNASNFIARAEAALGHPIDIISGYEEARLIYLGVSHGLEDAAEQRLVIDIGGGSTEFILGKRFDPLHMESLHMGCVGHSSTFFPGGRIDARTLRAAEIAARQEIEAIEIAYRRIGWQSAIGASGTILAVREIVLQQGWSQEGITPQSLVRLKQALLDAGQVERLTLAGLSEERRPVLPGGVAILCAAFEALGIERMRVSQSALREGLIYDLLGRIHQEDVRERTVTELVRRYHIDIPHSERISRTVFALFEQVASGWKLDADEHRSLLRWAAALHEIGLTVSHSQYQKHGEYLLTHLDLPGFARGEQRRLAMLVRAHRRKPPVTELKALPGDQIEPVMRLCVLLRLACVLHRRRSEEPLPSLRFSAEAQVLKLNFPEGWLAAHPLTRADLETEAGLLKLVGYKLKVK
jgi:exopolyphosphatase / guanosine-5'-triphosphate,3'-diphosphate pyrophosphatase